MSQKPGVECPVRTVNDRTPVTGKIRRRARTEKPRDRDISGPSCRETETARNPKVPQDRVTARPGPKAPRTELTRDQDGRDRRWHGTGLPQRRDGTGMAQDRGWHRTGRPRTGDGRTELVRSRTPQDGSQAGTSNKRPPHRSQGGQPKGRRGEGAKGPQNPQSIEPKQSVKRKAQTQAKRKRTHKKAPTKSKVAKGHTWGVWGARPPKMMRSGAGRLQSNRTHSAYPRSPDGI